MLPLVPQRTRRSARPFMDNNIKGRALKYYRRLPGLDLVVESSTIMEVMTIGEYDEFGKQIIRFRDG